MAGEHHHHHHGGTSGGYAHFGNDEDVLAAYRDAVRKGKRRAVEDVDEKVAERGRDAWLPADNAADSAFTMEEETQAHHTEWPTEPPLPTASIPSAILQQHLSRALSRLSTDQRFQYSSSRSDRELALSDCLTALEKELLPAVQPAPLELQTLLLHHAAASSASGEPRSPQAAYLVWSTAGGHHVEQRLKTAAQDNVGDLAAATPSPASASPFAPLTRALEHTNTLHNLQRASLHRLALSLLSHLSTAAARGERTPYASAVRAEALATLCALLSDPALKGSQRRYLVRRVLAEAPRFVAAHSEGSSGVHPLRTLAGLVLLALHDGVLSTRADTEKGAGKELEMLVRLVAVLPRMVDPHELALCASRVVRAALERCSCSRLPIRPSLLESLFKRLCHPGVSRPQVDAGVPRIMFELLRSVPLELRTPGMYEALSGRFGNVSLRHTGADGRGERGSDAAGSDEEIAARLLEDLRAHPHLGGVSFAILAARVQSHCLPRRRGIGEAAAAQAPPPQSSDVHARRVRARRRGHASTSYVYDSPARLLAELDALSKTPEGAAYLCGSPSPHRSAWRPAAAQGGGGGRHASRPLSPRLTRTDGEHALSLRTLPLLPPHTRLGVVASLARARKWGLAVAAAKIVFGDLQRKAQVGGGTDRRARRSVAVPAARTRDWEHTGLGCAVLNVLLRTIAAQHRMRSAVSGSGTATPPRIRTRSHLDTLDRMLRLVRAVQGRYARGTGRGLVDGDTRGLLEDMAARVGARRKRRQMRRG